MKDYIIGPAYFFQSTYKKDCITKYLYDCYICRDVIGIINNYLEYKCFIKICVSFLGLQKYLCNDANNDSNVNIILGSIREILGEKIDNEESYIFGPIFPWARHRITCNALKTFGNVYRFAENGRYIHDFKFITHHLFESNYCGEYDNIENLIKIKRRINESFNKANKKDVACIIKIKINNKSPWWPEDDAWLIKNVSELIISPKR